MHAVAQEHSVFTWDPVSARWIHERGPEVASPPVPPDVHAIQTYFYDEDGKEWIATVLAPRGRELAAQWQGAYKIPDRAAPPTTSGNKKSSPAPLFALVLTLLIAGGGAAVVVAGTQSTPSASPATPTSAPSASTDPSAPVAVSGEPTPATESTAPAPTQRPGGTPVRTQPVRTPVPTAPPPPGGTSIALADGSVVTYSGPSRVDIGASFDVTFTVRNANNTPGTGTLLVSFGNQSTGGSKSSSGTLSPQGQLMLHMPGGTLPGNYPFVVNYKGLQGQVAIVRIG
jgi:hypothetical protein